MSGGEAARLDALDGGAEATGPDAAPVRARVRARVRAQLTQLAGPAWGPDGPPLVVAVSGGSDSAGLLSIAAEAASGARVLAATVDHRLRPDSAAEAAEVARLAASLGVEHVILRWEEAPRGGAGTAGNLASAAREARYRLLADCARAAGAAAVAAAHTRDDVAETLLLRLARGSGVDGLAEMAEASQIATALGEPVALIRPCLDVSRAELRAVCRSAEIAWIDDPSNEDPRFDRTLARKALEALAPLGIDRTGLAATARRLRRARGALEESTDALIVRAARLCHVVGWAELDVAPLAEAPREIALRALARLLEWVSGAVYPPRLEPLEAVLDALLSNGAGRTLHGVTLEPVGQGVEPGRWRLCREAAATADPIAVFQSDATVWDRRWRFEVLRVETEGLGGPMAEVRLQALGEAGARFLAGAEVAMAAEFAAAPRRAQAATPALWSGNRLVAAPAAGVGEERLAAVLRHASPLRARRAAAAVVENRSDAQAGSGSA